MLIPSKVLEAREYYRMVTSVFLHADIAHLFNNMLLLGVAGDLLERRIGHIRFLILYLLSALTGNVVFLALEQGLGESVPTLGASGGVFGLFGALLVLVILHRGRFQGISLGRMLFMLVYAFAVGFMDPRINQAAHIGGFAAGIMLMLILGVPGVKQLETEAWVDNDHGNP